MCARSAVFESLERRQLLATYGLNAVYFNNRDFTGASHTGLNTAIAFDWPNHASPARGIKGTTFAVRWHGLIKAPTTETYTFTTRNNDGVRLWVNGKLIIDSWRPSVRATHSGSIAMKAKHLYDIRLEYFDSTRTAAINLFWSTPTRPQGHIPRTRMFAYDTRSASIGDYGWDNSNEAATAKLMRTWKPDFISTVGDNNYTEGSASTIDKNIGKYFSGYIGHYKGSYGSGPGVNLFFPTLGNHDWETAGAKPYLDYFTLPGNERYYDFVRGPIHFFALDSDDNEPDGNSPSSKQGQWLKNALAKSTSPFNIVYFHHSPFSSGSEGSTDTMQWPFADWGASVVLTGHSHEYERLSIDSIPYVVNGAGGKPEELHEPVAGSIIRDNSTAGALLIEANEYALTLQYQQITGKVIDTITIGRERDGTRPSSATAMPDADRVLLAPSLR